jgi:LacI family transcriptional regulator
MDSRMGGYRAALEENGIEANDTYIKECDNSIQGGYEGFKDVFHNHKDLTAIFTANHYLTMGVLVAANEMGIKIPDDISLVAFDYMQWHHILPLKLTVVEQPMEQIGQHAAEIMLRRLQNDSNDTMKEALTLSAKIRIGDSIKSIF